MDDWVAFISWHAALNIGVPISFQIKGFLVVFFFLVYKPRSRIIESYGSSMLFFWEISIMLSIVAVPIYIPTNSVQRFPFLHILSSICYL